MLCSIAAVLLLFILPLFTVFVQSAVVHRCGIGFGGGGRCQQETGHRRHKGEGRPIGIVAVIGGGGQRPEKLWHRESKKEQRLLEKKKQAIVQLQPRIWRFGGHQQQQQQQRRGPIILIKRKYRVKIPDKEVAKRDKKKNSTRKRRPKMSREKRKWRRKSIEEPITGRVELEKKATGQIGQIRTMRKLYPIYGLLRHQRQRCRGTKEAERKCGGKKRAKEIKKRRRAEEAQRKRRRSKGRRRLMEGSAEEAQRERRRSKGRRRLMEGSAEEAQRERRRSKGRRRLMEGSAEEAQRERRKSKGRRRLMEGSAQRERRRSKGKAIRRLMEGRAEKPEEQQTERRKTVRRWQTQGTGRKREQTEIRSRRKSSIKRRNTKAKKDITEEEEEKEEKEMKKTIRRWKTERKRELTEIPSRRRSSVKRRETETENGDGSGEEEEVTKTERKKTIRWNSSGGTKIGDETMSKRKSSIKRKDTEIESDTTEEEEEEEIELERKKTARGGREETEISSRRRSSVKRRETETENGDGSGEEEEEAKEKRMTVRWHSSEGKSGSSTGRRESSTKRRRSNGERKRSRAVKEKGKRGERRKTTTWGKAVGKMREKEREWTRVAEETEKRQKSIINNLARERMDRDVKEIENEEEMQNKETVRSAEKKGWKVTERAKSELMRRGSERRETERGTDTEHERFDGLQTQKSGDVVAEERPRATWGERLNSAGSFVTDRIGTAGGYLKNIWHRARGNSKGDELIAREHSGEERKNGAEGHHQDESASVEQQKQQKQLHPEHRKSLNRINIPDGRAINTDRSARNSIENSTRTLTIKPTNAWKRRKQSENLIKQKKRIGKAPPMFRRKNKPPEGLSKRKLTKGWKKP